MVGTVNARAATPSLGATLPTMLAPRRATGSACVPATRPAAAWLLPPTTTPCMTMPHVALAAHHSSPHSCSLENAPLVSSLDGRLGIIASTPSPAATSGTGQHEDKPDAPSRFDSTDLARALPPRLADDGPDTERGALDHLSTAATVSGLECNPVHDESFLFFSTAELNDLIDIVSLL
jgi:hypothetical protein